MTDGTSSAVLQGALDSLNKYTEMFCAPATRGVTGHAGDKTVLFVFEQGSAYDVWSDPATGGLLTTRPLQAAFLSRRSIQNATHVGYHSTRARGAITHHLVVFDDKRDVIARFDDVLGFRKEQ